MTRKRHARLMLLVWAAMVVTACNPFGPSSSEALTFDFEFASPAPGADVLVVAPGLLSLSAGSSFVVEVFDGTALLGTFISNELGRSFFRSSSSLWATGTIIDMTPVVNGTIQGRVRLTGGSITLVEPQIVNAGTAFSSNGANFFAVANISNVSVASD